MAKKYDNDDYVGSNHPIGLIDPTSPQDAATKNYVDLKVATSVALTDAATIATNAALGTTFYVTLGGNRTMGAPTNPLAGQCMIYRIVQPASGGPYTLTWNAVFTFGLDVPVPILSTGANKSDYVMFIYNGVTSVWNCLAIARGY